MYNMSNFALGIAFYSIFYGDSTVSVSIY
uniref:Uncharacterized protein n=1 Tax=Anguilla anguilla TaxID=7936 RepID=A0A0E9UBK2_ANGAN